MIPYAPAIALGVLLATFLAGRACGVVGEREEWQHKAQAQEVAQKKQESKTDAANLKEVIRYVDKVRTVERNVPVVRERLVRVCDDGPRWVVQGAGELAPTDASHSDSGSSDLAAELIAVREGLEQCRALIAVVTPQVAKE